MEFRANIAGANPYTAHRHNKLRRSAMSSHLPRLFLTRHGDTPWTESRQHTGRTDLALNARGEHNARLIGERLRKNYSFAHIFTSPLQRAAKTCELAGFGDRAEIEDNLMEWDY